MAGRRLALLIDACVGEHLPEYPGSPDDLKRLQEVLGAADIGQFNVTAVNGSDKATIEAALHRLFAESQRDDLLLFYFVGNLVIDRDNQLWFAAVTTNPAELERTAISAAFVRAEMTIAAVGQIVTVLDARISGYEDNFSAFPWDQQMEVAGKSQALLAALAGPDFRKSPSRSGRLVPDFSITKLINDAAVELPKNGNGFTVAELSLYLSTRIDPNSSALITRIDDAAGQIIFAEGVQMVLEPGAPTDEILSGSSDLPGSPPEENVQFTVYRPATLAVGHWQRMLVFTHIDENPDQSSEQNTPAQEVAQRAQRLLADELETYRQLAADSQFPIPRESEITLVPDIPHITFNPPRRSFVWATDLRVHDESFLLRAPSELAGSLARGRLSIFLGHLLVADIAINFRIEPAVSSLAPSESLWTQSSARPFRKVFASYSHHDAQIVEAMEHHVKALGYDYLRDIVHLRSGQTWNDRLLEMIKEADIFQLFWSSNSARSSHVEREWRYALALSREAFIRPAFWEVPMPLPPQPLQDLHFYRLPALVPAIGQYSSVQASTTVSEEPRPYRTAVPPVPESAMPSKPLPVNAYEPPPSPDTKIRPQRKRRSVFSAILGGIAAVCLVTLVSFYGGKLWFSQELTTGLSQQHLSTAGTPLTLATPPPLLATPAATPLPVVGATPPLVETPAALASTTPHPTKRRSSEPRTPESIAKPMPH